MSFLIDPPWLYANGEAYARLAPDSAQGTAARVLGVATIAAFWIVSVSAYLNRGWTRLLWKPFRSRDGRDFMVNSGVLRFDTQRAGGGLHLVSALIFATYPLWLLAGYRRGRRARLARG